MFLNIIRAIYDKEDSRLLSTYKRSLPLQDTFIDRWKRAEKLGFAKGVSIYNSALVFGDVNVGGNTWIGPNVILDGSSGSLTIGEYCSISAGTQIYTHDTVEWALSGGKAKQKTGAVTIGDRCYIGPMCVIKLGVSIGSGSVVGAGSYVNKDIPGGTVWAGSPAKQIGIVKDDLSIQLI